MTEQEATTTEVKRAGLFDLRWVIALLFAFYGIVLVVVGIGFTSEAALAKAAGANVNLWTGVGMLGLSVVFAGWAQLRPLKVPTRVPEAPADDAFGAGER